MWTTDPDILVTDLGDELVLMDPRGSMMFSLNAAGRLLWQSLPASADVLAQRLQTVYGLDADQARADSQAVLDDLAARRLVKLV